MHVWYQNNRVWACINRTKITNSPSLPKSSIWPMHIWHETLWRFALKQYVKHVGFQKTRRAQKLIWINFRCPFCREKSTTFPKDDLNPEAVCEIVFPPYLYIYIYMGKLFFSQTASGLRRYLGRVVNFTRQTKHLKFIHFNFWARFWIAEDQGCSNPSSFL
jgi:hypothetical protein